MRTPSHRETNHLTVSGSGGHSLPPRSLLAQPLLQPPPRHSSGNSTGRGMYLPTPSL